LNSLEEIKAQFMPILQESGLKTGQALWPLRFALSGAEFSPGVFELMWVIGLDETRKRLNNALDYLRTL
jgi:glutamyl/glutaminyl-tRNA synthetase